MSSQAQQLLQDLSTSEQLNGRPAHQFREVARAPEIISKTMGLVSQATIKTSDALIKQAELLEDKARELRERAEYLAKTVQPLTKDVLEFVEYELASRALVDSFSLIQVER